MRINTNQFNINFKNNSQNNEGISSGEFFAGGGGWTEGIHKIPGVKTKWILNHDKLALKTNSYHHRDVKVYWADIYAQDEHDLEPVDYIHASIECTQHSIANGGRKKKIGSYTMGWELYRYIKFLQPLVLTIENVPEFKKWSPVDEFDEPIKGKVGEEFKRWKQSIIDLGYEYQESIRNAADDGLPTKRVRYFAIFYRAGIDVTFPEFTHSKEGTFGKSKWKSCEEHIDTTNEGVSIFGREFNESLPKHLRRPLKPNSLRRIGGGIKKFYPEFTQFISSYYGSKNENNIRCQSLDVPINTIPARNQHQLVTIEKLKFIMDHCHSDNYNLLEDPLNPQLTRQTKQFVNFICQYYSGSIQLQDLKEPINTIPSRDTHQLVRFEKIQFLTKYFSSNGKPENNIESLEDPISVILGDFKHQLVTILDNFDIKVRFLNAQELAACSTFPKDYFTNPGLKLSQKNSVKMIGNAVPPLWARVLMENNIPKIQEYKSKNLAA